MKAAYTRYGPPDVLELWAIQKDSSPTRAKFGFSVSSLTRAGRTGNLPKTPFAGTPVQTG
jgi:hypothetical protein